MPRRVRFFIVLGLCCLTTGAQWDLLQALAWGRMMANYSRTESLQDAVASTFNGEMCNICRMVAAARQQERSHSPAPEAKAETKLVFFFQSVPAVVVEAPGQMAWRPAPARSLTQWRAMPAVPPPRSGLV